MRDSPRAVTMMSRETLVNALYCRTSTHYGIACNRCPYGRKAGSRWVCDVSKICHDVLEALKADNSEINSLAKLSNEYKVRLMARGESFK